MKHTHKLLAIMAMSLSINWVAPAMAHHSAAMFDESKKVELTGTVKEFLYTNPHAWIQLLVPDQKTGEVKEWSIQLGAPGSLYRLGWKRSVLKPGDEIIITASPMRDGSPAGQFVSAIRKGGAPIVGEPAAK